MKNQNNQKSDALKLLPRRRDIVNLLGAALVICAVLDCSISELKFGEKKTGGKSRNNTTGKTKNSDKSGDSSNFDETAEERLRETFGRIIEQSYRGSNLPDRSITEASFAEEFSFIENGEIVTKKDMLKSSGAKDWILGKVKSSRIVSKEGDRAVVEYTAVNEYTDRNVTETCQAEFVKKDKWQIRKLLSCSDKFTTKK